MLIVLILSSSDRKRWKCWWMVWIFIFMIFWPPLMLMIIWEPWRMMSIFSFALYMVVDLFVMNYHVRTCWRNIINVFILLCISMVLLVKNDHKFFLSWMTFSLGHKWSSMSHKCSWMVLRSALGMVINFQSMRHKWDINFS